MPGMGGSPIQLTNPFVVALFRHALFFTSALWIVAIGLVILLGATFTQRVFEFNLSTNGLNEPRARTFLRWGFGTLWIFDGILQFQPSMPLGLANNVVAPAAVGTPSWLHAVMYSGIGVWNSHPVALAVATAWIQVGIGLLLLVSNAGVGRVASVVSVGWASMIWLVGNGAGGIFSPSSSILFGWPGATLFYVVAGAWLALDYERFSRNFARSTVRGLSVLLVTAAIVQCLPGRQFWHGGNSNALTSMTSSMTQVAQPHWLSWIVTKGGVLAGTLGGGFNLAIVMWLVGCAIGLWMSTQRGWRWPLWTLVGGCVVIWLVGEDAAIFGGLATDVNSLPPLALLAWCAAPNPRSLVPLERRLPREMRSSSGAVAVSFAASMVLYSVVSMGWASVASAENSLFLAQNGPASAVNSKAPSFSLIDQSGVPYRLGEHSGRFTVLTFLDPRCYTDCPLLANQLRVVRSSLSRGAKIDMVAVAANPFHETVSDVKQFIKRRGLSGARDFYFVTSAHLNQVKKVWTDYGIGVQMKPTDKMSVHSDYVFIIDPHGQLRWIVPDNPLESWSGQRSAESELLTLLHGLGVK